MQIVRSIEDNFPDEVIFNCHGENMSIPILWNNDWQESSARNVHDLRDHMFFIHVCCISYAGCNNHNNTSKAFEEVVNKIENFLKAEKKQSKMKMEEYK